MINYLFNSISRSGVTFLPEEIFIDKLITRNRLSFFCALFSFFYLLYFIGSGLILPSVGIIISITLFVLSIFLNRYGKIKLSAFVILIATNYSVLFTSLIFGFKSGFHLYLITSPLIIFILFDLKKTVYNALAIAMYGLNFLLLIFLDKSYHYSLYDLTPKQSELFYTVNFIFTIIILIVLFLYFILNNKKINSLLINKNELILRQQSSLKDENHERQKAEEKLSRSLEDKEILLSEIHHRVKNNLAVVSGLMELQTLHMKDEKLRNAIQESKNRIKAIALLHEKLYEGQDVVSVSVSESINELLKYITLTPGFKSSGVSVDLKIDEFDLSMERALPVSLIVNELFSNSGKLASGNKEGGFIHLALTKQNNTIILNYNDKRTGSVINKKDEATDFSNELIEVLAKQLNATYQFNTSPGFGFKMEFKL